MFFSGGKRGKIRENRDPEEPGVEGPVADPVVTPHRFHGQMRSTTSQSMQYYLSQLIQISRSNAQHNFTKYAILSESVNTDFRVKCAAQLHKLCNII